MQTKHLCVLVHIRIKGEVGIIKHVIFAGRYKAVLLLLICFVNYVSCLSTFACLFDCSHVTCWEKALTCCVFVCFCHFPMCVLIHFPTKGEVYTIKHI